MSKNYKVKVNQKFSFSFEKEEIDSLDIQKASENSYHVLWQDKSHKAFISSTDFNSKSYHIKVNGNKYAVKISNELDLLIEEMGLSLGSSQQINDIKAPMPGLILNVNVNEGDQVEEGDYLLVLEAMKMENTLTAPRDGKVKAIHVKKGESVDKNALLIEME